MAVVHRYLWHAVSEVPQSFIVVHDMVILSPPVRLLHEELQLLQEQGSHVGEVIKPMNKKKVLVKVSLLP